MSQARFYRTHFSDYMVLTTKQGDRFKATGNVVTADTPGKVEIMEERVHHFQDATEITHELEVETRVIAESPAPAIASDLLSKIRDANYQQQLQNPSAGIVGSNQLIAPEIPKAVTAVPPPKSESSVPVVESTQLKKPTATK